jgi:sortase A
VSPTAKVASEGTGEHPKATPTSTKPALLPADPPDQLVIPAIDLDSPIIPIGWQTVQRNGQTTRVWQVADDVAGWHKTSALPGQVGNVVLNGHHNIKGEVFRYLIDLEVGDRVWVHAQDKVYTYVVSEKHILKELGEPLEVRRQNAQWMNPTEDERLTMITCWPYTSNTHRLIVVAKPVSSLTTEDDEGRYAP